MRPMPEVQSHHSHDDHQAESKTCSQARSRNRWAERRGLGRRPDYDREWRNVAAIQFFLPAKELA